MSGIDPGKLAEWFGDSAPGLVLYARQWLAHWPWIQKFFSSMSRRQVLIPLSQPASINSFWN